MLKVVNGQQVRMTDAEVEAFEASRRPSVADAKAGVRARVRAARIAAEQRGASSGGRMVKADPESIERLRALQDAATPGERVPVELVDGSVVEVPSAAITGLLQAAQARMLAVLQEEAEKQQELAMLTTLADVAAFDATGGFE